MDCNGHYLAAFDPDCWGWRTDFSRGREVVGRFYGVFTIRLKRIFDPLYDRGDPNAVASDQRGKPHRDAGAPTT